MREVSSSLANALLRSASLAVLIAAGCGGGSGGGGGKLETNAAVEAAIGVVVSTGKALPAVFLDLNLELRALAERSSAARRRVANGAPGASKISCEGGGTYRAQCTIDVRGETALDVEYDGCVDGQEPARRRDGMLSVRALQPELCLSGDFRDDLPFSIVLSGFRSTVRDADGAEMARLDADLTESIDPRPGGCFTTDGTRSVSGTLAVQNRSTNADLAVEARDLTLEVSSSGEPCEQRITASGGFDVDDRGTGQHFTQTFDDAVFALSSENALTAVSLHAKVSNSCIGDVEITSDEPLGTRVGEDCPVGGALRLDFADGAAGIIRFTKVGGADIDFGADGALDESVASCVDESLARCGH